MARKLAVKGSFHNWASVKGIISCNFRGRFNQRTKYIPVGNHLEHWVLCFVCSFSISISLDQQQQCLILQLMYSTSQEWATASNEKTVSYLFYFILVWSISFHPLCLWKNKENKGVVIYFFNFLRFFFYFLLGRNRI